MQATQNKPLSLSPVTDDATHVSCSICDRNYELDGYVPANVARQMEIQLRALIDLIDVQTIVGEPDCECLQRGARIASAALNEL